MRPYSFRTNENTAAPLATVTYCRPSSSYVMGAFVTAAPSFACQSGSPVAASSASMPPAPAVNNTLPAVVRMPAFAVPNGQRWLQRICPVR